MKHREMASDNEQIKDVIFSIDDDICTLRWRWPNGVDAVYIVQAKEDEQITVGNVSDKNARLYTKDEYMEFNGYKQRIIGVGKFAYYIYPYVKENGTMLLVDQDNILNHTIISAGKVRIYIAVKKRKRLFSDKAIVRITVRCEAAISRDILCYTKKAMSHPASNRDGLMFTFIEDFKPGENILPDIEINKDEYINIFLTDYERYGSLYEICAYSD